MAHNNEKTNKFAELSHLIEDSEHVWILIHDGPDPDCMAASTALQQLLKSALGCQSTIVGGGYVQRPDNRAMVEMLNIEIIPPKKAMIPEDEPVITIDTQPAFTNNSLPPDARVIGVIDHHLSDSDCRAPFLDLRPEFGAAASIIAQYFRDSGTGMHRRTATALAFGIASETRDMERVKRQIEVELYTWVLSLADHPILGRLRNPKIERDYVCTLSRALNTAYLYSSDCLTCHMPQLPRTDDLGRIADFFDQMEVVKWVLCTENKGDSYLMSIRSSNKDAESDRVAAAVIADSEGDYGGHGMMAGGIIKKDSIRGKDETEKTNELTQRFLNALGKNTENTKEKLLY